ncbi:Zonular occludens toxin (Zot) [Anaerovirgula multivorans]|uniref:Zonular occludens toxin (Zot) n=1 Tax=Anaerovirgula multivorans TaxID=312168 RepID=A0A239B5D8_9FIRM|nr:zonular occludens toxin domain-containing protein [Anaerovirgula multivorans]SNS03107.1 Zonular occludens toxin (Zot) [Anaerovirgula multivorans]
MIYFYSGTPGSGKSLKVSQEIIFKLVKRQKNVIACNFQANYDYIRKNPKIVKWNKIRKKIGFKLKNENYKNIGKLYTFSLKHTKPEYFINYALKFHKVGIESQTLIVIDEAQSILSPTVVKLKCQEDRLYREKWIDFFTQHRHLGFDVILVSQFDRLIDPQIRCLFEYDYAHRKCNNYGLFGVILEALGISLFVQVQKWYGIREKMGHEFFVYKKKYAEIYNSYKKFSDLKQKNSIKKKIA